MTDNETGSQYSPTLSAVLSKHVNGSEDEQVTSFTVAYVTPKRDVQWERASAEVVLIGIILGTITIVTILGNLLVCVTVLTNRRMHNITNYFLASLATSDLLLGLFVLPLGAVITLASHWPLGAAFCNVFCACDVMLCTVSILTLFAISLDRHFAITAPFR